MKIDRVHLYAMLALTLCLCACDSGDKKESGAPVALPPKKVKETPANAQPPESTEPVKNMNASAGQEGGAGAGGPAIDPDQAVNYLNGMIKMYAQKTSGGQVAMMSGMDMTNPKAAQKIPGE